MDHNDPVGGPEAHNGGGTQRGGWTSIWNSLVVAFFVVLFGTAVVTYGALTPYGYWVGTPAKATVDHCELQHISSWDRDTSPDLRCTGTWSLHGQSQTGPIKPPFHDEEQNGIHAGKSVLDVRVHNGTAYTKFSVGKSFYVALAVGAGALVWGSFRLRRAWRNRS
jgi:hypothetical protein